MHSTRSGRMPSFRSCWMRQTVKDDLPAGQDLPVPPPLRKYFTHCIVKYHTTTTVTYFRHSCAVSVHQGGPFGTTPFQCAALHVLIILVMVQHPDVETAAYADNIYLVVLFTRAHNAFDTLPKDFMVGLTKPNRTRCPGTLTCARTEKEPCARPAKRCKNQNPR